MLLPLPPHGRRSPNRRPSTRRPSTSSAPPSASASSDACWSSSTRTPTGHWQRSSRPRAGATARRSAAPPIAWWGCSGSSGRLRRRPRRKRWRRTRESPRRPSPTCCATGVPPGQPSRRFRCRNATASSRCAGLDLAQGVFPAGCQSGTGRTTANSGKVRPWGSSSASISAVPSLSVRRRGCSATGTPVQHPAFAASAFRTAERPPPPAPVSAAPGLTSVSKSEPIAAAEAN